MEEELKCPVCRSYYCKPLLLPCSHSVCTACALNIQEPAQQYIQQTTTAASSASEDGSQVINETVDYPDIDKLSIVSETDSGVVCNSRPSSYVGTPCVGNIYTTQAVLHSFTYAIKCPSCQKLIFLDDSGANSLPSHRVLEAIVDKYTSDPKHVEVKCQLCENESDNTATTMCEQCEVFYCDSCRDSCHPAKGPLAKHNLVDPSQGKTILRVKKKSKETKCSEHVEEVVNMYCCHCRMPVCCLCAQEVKHNNHDIQALGALCKSQKVSLCLSKDHCMFDLTSETSGFLVSV